MMNLQPADIQEFPDIDVDTIANNLFVSMTQDSKNYVAPINRKFSSMSGLKALSLDGPQFTYDRHEYLLEPYQVFHPHQIGIKFTQMINRKVVKSDDFKFRTSCHHLRF